MSDEKNEQKCHVENDVSPSTVGMSIYGILVICQRPMTRTELELMIRKGGFFYEEKLIDRAIEGLLSRGRINFDGDRYSSKDKRKRPVIQRNRDDMKADPVTGELSGGWEGWIVKEIEPTWTIEEVLEQC